MDYNQPIRIRIVEPTPNKPLSVISVLPAAFLLSLIGFGGLVAVVFLTLPTLGPRWLFFFLSMLAVTGLALPAVCFLNLRFPSNPPAEPGVILRQAIWMGVYGAALVWLQLGRMLTPAGAGGLAVGLILIEALLRMREISRWRPKAETD